MAAYKVSSCVNDRLSDPVAIAAGEPNNGARKGKPMALLWANFMLLVAEPAGVPTRPGVRAMTELMRFGGPEIILKGVRPSGMCADETVWLLSMGDTYDVAGRNIEGGVSTASAGEMLARLLVVMCCFDIGGRFNVTRRRCCAHNYGENKDTDEKNSRSKRTFNCMR